MSLSYSPGTNKPWIIDTRQLRYRYYVQLSPDQQHVVPGSVLQGTRPPVGDWLELGTIRKKLAARYFVQQTTNNTLVPGLLIQSDTPPGNNWKDIQSQPLFHVINFDDFVYDAFEISGEYTFATNEEFINDIVNPALDLVYPNRDQEKPVRLQLFYFRNNYDRFVEFQKYGPYTDLLTPFATADVPAKLGYFLTDLDTLAYVNIFENTTTEPAIMTIDSTAQPDVYSFILAVLNSNNEAIEYIFLNKILYYHLAQ